MSNRNRISDLEQGNSVLISHLVRFVDNDEWFTSNWTTKILHLTTAYDSFTLSSLFVPQQLPFYTHERPCLVTFSLSSNSISPSWQPSVPHSPDPTIHHFKCILGSTFSSITALSICLTCLIVNLTSISLLYGLPVLLREKCIIELIFSITNLIFNLSWPLKSAQQSLLLNPNQQLFSFP